MAANLTDEDGEITEINITPFVDVVLVLLVIFMVTAPAMIKESLKVKLPKTLTSALSGDGTGFTQWKNSDQNFSQ